MTPIKDTLELGNLSSETAVPQASGRPRQESGHLRSDAVSLEVPVKVHGSRVTEVVRGMTAHTEPFEEQSATIIVFPQGGVVKMSAAVNAGQMVVITNLKSGQDAICRVLKVRPYSNGQSYVEIEFTQRQAGYWGVYFPSDGPAPAKKVAPAAAAPVAPVVATAAAPPATPEAPAAAAPVAPLSHADAAEDKAVADVSSAPEPAPAAKPSDASAISSPANRASAPPDRHLKPNLPESRFVSIGSQEDVQLAASSTTGAKADPFGDSGRKSRAGEASMKSAAIDFPEAPPAASSSLSMAELQGDALPAALKSAAGGAEVENAEGASPVAAQPSVEERPVTFGHFAAGAGLGGARSASQEMFGVRLDPAAAGGAGETAGPRRNWVWIAVGVAALLAALAGGAYYFQERPTANRATSSIPKAPVPAPSAEANAMQDSVSQPAIFNSSSDSHRVAQASPVNPVRALASEAAVKVRATEAAPTKPDKASPVVASQPSAPVQQRDAISMHALSGELNSHPVSSRPASAGPSDAAPSVDAGGNSGSANGELPAIAASSVKLAVPAQPVPEAPLRVGGEIKPPRMISSILPVYPSIARQAGVEGSVVIDTVVDKAGNVTSMKVVSGPAMLRQAALDALRHWKYEPSTLNGQPVSVNMIVTIQFHR